MKSELTILQKDIDDYIYQNEKINEVLIDKKNSGLSLYIDIEDDMLSQLSIRVLNTVDSFIKDLGITIKKTLAWDKPNIYQYYLEQQISWNRNHKPPFTALLVLFSYAAEMMGKDDDFIQNNYFQRLMELMDGTNEQRELLQKNSKNTQIFWEEFNIWLKIQNYDYGIPTARIVLDHTPYISYPISQSLIRDAERKRFHRLFEAKNWNKYKNIEKNLYEDLNEWMISNNPNKWLKKLWYDKKDKDFFQSKIQSGALEEFKSWVVNLDPNLNGEMKSYDNFLKWTLEWDEFANIELFMVSDDLVIEQDELNLIANNDKKELLSRDNNIYLTRNKDKFELTPISNLNIDALLNIDIELYYESLKFIHKSKPVIILKDEGNDIFVETDEIKTLTNYCFICNDSASKGIEKFFKENDITINKLETGSLKDKGINNGWQIYRDIFFSYIPDTSKTAQLDGLFGLIDKPEFAIYNGLNIHQNIWHANYLPNIILSDGDQSYPFLIKKYGTELYFDHENGKIINNDKQSFENTTLELICEDTSLKINKKQIHLRSANNPYSNYDDKKNIAYTKKSLFSAQIINNEDQDIIIGNYTNISNNISDNSDLEKYLDYKFSNTVTEDIMVKKSYFSSQIPNKADCMVYGIHVWKCPAYDDKVTDYMICEYCKITVPIPKLQKYPPKYKRKIVNSSQKIENLKIKYKKDYISTDNLFDAACYKGFGRLNSIDRIGKYLLESPLDSYLFKENLINLGHIDVIRQRGNQIKYWNISQPTINIKEESIYISGFRSQKFIEEIDVVFKNFNLSKYSDKQNLAPAKIAWNSLPENKIEEFINQINEIKLELDLTSKILFSRRETGINMLTNLSKLINYQNDFEKFELNSADNFEKFSFDIFNWIPSKMNDIGAYRPKESRGVYYFFDGDKLNRTDYTTVLNISSILSDKIVHEYDEKNMTFSCIKKIDIPGIYKRILIAETGILPKDDGKYLSYRGISKELGLLMMDKLYG